MSAVVRISVTLLPVVALLAGAANHVHLVRTHGLSPWLGGGFGMFSTADVGSSRHVFVTAILHDGDERTVILRETLQDLEHRARALPDPATLGTLAQATWAALEGEGSGADAGALAALRIEVWRTRYAPGTLRPSMERIAEERFEAAPGDG